MFRKSVTFLLFQGMIVLCFGLGFAVAQPPDGQSQIGSGTGKGEKKAKTPPKPVRAGKSGGSSTGTGSPTTRRPEKNRSTTPDTAAKTQADECAESELLIDCDLPECSVLVDGRSMGITDLNGELQLTVASGKRKLVISKDGYETAPQTIDVNCGELNTAHLRLKSRPFEIRLKTNLPDCDILIDDPPQPVGKTDGNGFFVFQAQTGTVFVQAKKAGYLSDGKSISLAMARKEISFNLKPAPARVQLNINVAGAFARVEGNEKIYDTSEPFWLEPGLQKLVVTGLGFKPFVLELNLAPNQRVERTIGLERLPVAELLAQAEESFKARSFEKTQQLCRHALETEPGSGAANRLLGMVFLERQKYAEAEQYFLKALENGETVILDVRRHPGEKFELNSGHGPACEGRLLLGKGDIQYRGTAAAAENFKTPPAAIQIVGLQMKKSAALFLALKVADIKGNKKDYNFFSADKELSSEGRLYLEMIQRLLQRLKI